MTFLGNSPDVAFIDVSWLDWVMKANILQTIFRLIGRDCYLLRTLPLSQYGPLNPSVHTQRYPFCVKPVWQDALFWHEFCKHAFWVANYKINSIISSVQAKNGFFIQFLPYLDSTIKIPRICLHFAFLSFKSCVIKFTHEFSITHCRLFQVITIAVRFHEAKALTEFRVHDGCFSNDVIFQAFPVKRVFELHLPAVICKEKQSPVIVQTIVI